MPAGGLVLAVDVGSSAVRVAAIHPDGAVAADHRVARPDSSAGLTFDPELLWTQLSEAVGGLPSSLRSTVAAIGIAGHVGTVFVDRALRPVAPGLGWADTGGIDLLRQRLGSRMPELLHETGRPIATGGAAAASLLLRVRDAEAFRRVAHILAPKDFLIARLTGAIATDHTSAAYTGLSRIIEGSWSEAALAAVDLDRDLLPPQVGSAETVGGLAPRTAAELGLPSGAPVVSGGPDGTVGATFMIGDHREVVADIAGTTDVLVRLVDGPGSAPQEALVNPYTLGGFSAGGATGMTGGALARWAQLLGYGGVTEATTALGGLAGTIRPGAGGLRISPTLSGSRFPRWRPEDTGAVLGHRDEHRPEHFVLAVAEGAAYVVRDAIDRLDEAGESRAVVALAGGVARSELLAQLRADVLNRTVLLRPQPDVTLLGAALLALRGAEMDVEGAFRPGPGDLRLVHPDATRVAAYQELFSAWLTAQGAA